MAMIRRRSDRQHRADRLDSIRVSMIVDEADHHFPRRSSSAWAKYADAFRRISFARFSSRTSRPQLLATAPARSSSGPGRCPASRYACRTHFRSVSAVQPSFGATDCSTAHSEAWASRCSSTIRTARSRTSGENRLGRPIDPILPSNEVSEKPGTIQCLTWPPSWQAARSQSGGRSRTPTPSWPVSGRSCHACLTAAERCCPAPE